MTHERDIAKEPGIDRGAITGMLREIERGDRAAVDRLFAVVYDELHRLARRQLRSAPSQQTLSTTALVHEAYLKLSTDADWSTRDRYHFFSLTARAMRQILIDHVRRRTRKKRGGRDAALSLDTDALAAAGRGEEMLALDDALRRLEADDADLARVVEWRFFGGLSVAEIAETLAVSDRTIKRRWRIARAFLYRELSAQGFGL